MPFKNHCWQNENELKFAKEHGFFEKSLSIRILIGCIFTLCLFAFLHFREVRVEVLEVNHVASDYVVARIDFDYFDEKTTIILRQEAVRDIGTIFQISPKEIRSQRGDYHQFVVDSQKFRDELGDKAYEKVYPAGELVEKILGQLRFTDLRTFQKLEEVKMTTSNYFVFSPTNVESGQKIPQSVWSSIRERVLREKNMTQEAVDFALGYFQEKQWLLESDISEEKTLKRKIQANILDSYTHVTAGSRILDQGEKVSSQHIAMMQAMKMALAKERDLWHPLTLIGTLMITLLAVGICYAYFAAVHPHILRSNRKLFLIVTIVLLTLVIAKCTELLLLHSHANWIEAVRFPIFVPFAAILICSLISPTAAAFVSGFLAIVLAMALAFDREQFLLVNLVASMVAVLCARNLKKRKEVFIVCAKAYVASVVVITAVQLYFEDLSGVGLLSNIISSGFFLIFIALLVIGFLPLLESSFRIMTDATLMEYMDPNNELLRRLSVEAPGSYQHSVIVGNLAETAALAIGANGLFCRVATLYHDIGKMATPQYFTENQNGCMNIHQLLTPQESTQVIIAHVSEGVAMARRAGLPEQFIDIIKEHHGTTLAYYFYSKQLEKMGGDKSLVDENEFRYSGPKPRTKESAIIMIADCLEAASRSLDKIDEKSVSQLACTLIRQKLEDGQFDHTSLTLHELSLVKDAFVKTIAAYGHSRIKYPTREKND